LVKILNIHIYNENNILFYIFLNMIKSLFLTLIVFGSVLNNQFIIDLDNEDRIVSKYLRDLRVTDEWGIWIGSPDVEEKISTKIGSQIDIKWTNSGLGLTIPSLEIWDNFATTNLDYSLTVFDCQYCSTYDYITEKAVNNANINCAYKHGDFTLTKRKATKIEKEDLKNFIVGDYNIRLVNWNRKVLVEKNDSEAVDLNEFVKDSEDLKKTSIHDMFIFLHKDTYFLSLVNYNELIVLSFKFDAETGNIKFKFEETIRLTDLGIVDFKEIIQIMFINQPKFFIFVKNGFYIFTKSGNTWNRTFIESLEKVTLKDINVYAYMQYESLYAFISVKGVGLIGIDILADNRQFMFLEHKQIIGIQTHQHHPTLDNHDVFSLGLLIDNTVDTEVNEFFVELSISVSSPVNYNLNRAFISSKIIKAVQTDHDNKITAFLTDDIMYIIPRGHQSLKSFPVYFFDSGLRRSHSDFILYRKGEKFIFLITDLNNSDKDFYEFYQREEDGPRYECVFQNKGNYDVKFTDPPHFIDDKAIVRQVFNVDVKANWIMIMVYVIIGIVALILFIVAVRYCIKKRNSNSGASHEALITG
jgi:hypothetical protein